MLCATSKVSGGPQSPVSLFWGSRAEKFGNHRPTGLPHSERVEKEGARNERQAGREFGKWRRKRKRRRKELKVKEKRGSRRNYVQPSAHPPLF